ncbi:hypothetical protein TNCV_2540621 [Trichonephila clavipes]|nr:hypothetical protein TNCV_2540621 [Trichonephila clavipes]
MFSVFAASDFWKSRPLSNHNFNSHNCRCANLQQTLHGTRARETERDRTMLADCDGKETFKVISSGKFTFKLKMKISFIEFQVSALWASPGASVCASGWVSKLELSPTQFEEIRGKHF